MAILLNSQILPIGGGKGLGRVCTQPAKQACFYIASTIIYNGIVETFLQFSLFSECTAIASTGIASTL